MRSSHNFVQWHVSLVSVSDRLRWSSADRGDWNQLCPAPDILAKHSLNLIRHPRFHSFIAAVIVASALFDFLPPL